MVGIMVQTSRSVHLELPGHLKESPQATYPERSVSLELSVAMESVLLFAVFEFVAKLLSSFGIARLLSRSHTGGFEFPK